MMSFYLIGYSNEHLEEHIALSHTAGHLGSTIIPQVGPILFSDGVGGDDPGTFFLLMPTKQRKISS